MLSAVLRSNVAVDASVRIIRAFVEMRHFIASNAAMFEQIRVVELRQPEYQKTTDERFECVCDYMEVHEAPKQRVFNVTEGYIVGAPIKDADKEGFAVTRMEDTATIAGTPSRLGGSAKWISSLEG